MLRLKEEEKELCKHSSKTSFSDFYNLEDTDPSYRVMDYNDPDPEPQKPYMPTTNSSERDCKKPSSIRTKNMMCNRPPRPKSVGRRPQMK